MAAAMTPLLSAYWDEAGKTTRGKLGLDPDEWRVTDPHTKQMIEQASFNFCAETNATTKLTLDKALEKLRAELVAGIVTHGDSIPELTRRVQKVFTGAETWRANMIARTETARAVHAASHESARTSGVVQGKKWLAAANSCPLCLAEAAKPAVPLEDNFTQSGNNPVYKDIAYPPLHPHDRCSVSYVLTPEYETLLAEEGPPAGPIEPGPLGPIPKDYEVHHPPVADRVPKPSGRPAPPPMPVSTPADKPEPAPKPKDWPDSLDDLEVIQKLGGSTGAELVRDKLTGKTYVRKQGNNPGHLLEEMAADDLYRAAGARVPDSKLYRTAAGAPVKLSKYIEGGRTLGDLLQNDPARAELAMAQLRKHFAIDALLGNWDVVGTNWDNILVDELGRTYRIDNGGSLRYRAQGALKAPSQFGPTVGELDSLRSPSVNRYAAKAFGSITDDELRKQCKEFTTAARRKKLLASLPEPLREVIGQRLDSIKAYATPPKTLQPRKVKGWKPLPADQFREFKRDDEASMNGWGKPAYRAWAAGLSRTEVHDLAYYTGSGYEDMNNATRKAGYNASAETRKRVERLTKALERGRLEEPITIYRGIKRLNDMGLAAKDLGYGDLIQGKGFASNSLDLKVAERFAANGPDRGIFKIRVPKGTPGAYVNASDAGSSVPGEREFLLPPGKFNLRVVDVQTTGKHPIITVELVP
jgi:hypothetical protein